MSLESDEAKMEFCLEFYKSVSVPCMSESSSILSAKKYCGYDVEKECEKDPAEVMKVVERMRKWREFREDSIDEYVAETEMPPLYDFCKLSRDKFRWMLEAPEEYDEMMKELTEEK